MSEKALNWQHCAHLYSPLSLCLTAAAHTFSDAHTHTHTYRNIWTTANQRRGPPFTISDWFRPRYGPNVCLLLNHRETFRVIETSFFSRMAGRTGVFFSRTIEKLVNWSHSRALLAMHITNQKLSSDIFTVANVQPYM